MPEITRHENFVEGRIPGTFISFGSTCNGNTQELYDILLTTGKFSLYSHLNIPLDFTGNSYCEEDFIGNAHYRKESESKVLGQIKSPSIFSSTFSKCL